MKNKTWNEFWGEFLQVTFHEGHPDLWPSRQKKALWAQKHFQLPDGSKILDLGCGDGKLDICFSQMGFDVTAVDRNKKVLQIAQATDDKKKVQFISSELTAIDFEPQSFDAVIFIETSGLMNKLDELNLFKKMYSWLKPNGKLILDCPETASLKHSWSKEFSIGIARGVSSFDEISRIQNIQFYFQPHGEEEFGIYDPYDLEKRDLPGIIRYLYPKSEIIPILENIGLTISEIDHYYEKNYFGLMGIKKPMLETK